MQHRVFFADEDAAIAAGDRPCGSCLRLKDRQWVADHPSWPLAALDPRALGDSPHLPGGRGDLLERAGLHDQAGEAFTEAAARSSNESERAVLRRRAAENRSPGWLTTRRNA